MNLNRGNTSIIVISVIVALILFIAAGSIGGYFIWKNYFSEEQEEEEREKNNGLIIPEDVVRDEQGFVDCGRSVHDEKSFNTPFMGINFDEDKTFSCMGKNYNNSCSKARLVVNIDGTDLTYKFLESGSKCYARLEADNLSTGNLEWIQCPIPSLISFVNEQAETVSTFNELREKMNSGDGNFSASIFTALAVVLSGNVGSIESFGCQTNF